MDVVPRREHHRPLVGLARQPDLPLARDELEHAQHAPEHGRHRNGIGLVDMAAVQPRQPQQVLRDAREPVGLARSMSVTNSRVISGGMSSVCRMESVSSRMPANGVFSSWLASDTNRRRAFSVVCKRSVRLLNSAAIWAISSVPLASARWLYAPSRTLRMACKSR